MQEETQTQQTKPGVAGTPSKSSNERMAEARITNLENIAALSTLGVKVANAYMPVIDGHAELLNAGYKARIATHATFEEMRQGLLKQTLEADAETLEIIGARLEIINAVMK